MKKSSLLILFTLLSVCLFAETVTVADQALNVEVLSTSEQLTRLHFTLGSFDRRPVEIDGTQYYTLEMDGEPLTFEKGAPELPKMVRSIVVGDDAEVAVTVTGTAYKDFEMTVAPSKGILYRDIDPADVPYEVGEVYEQDAFYPGTLAQLSEPYILRDYRGVAVTAYPFQYNPVNGILRVYTDMTVEIERTGTSMVNVKTRTTDRINAWFSDVYRNHFINLSQMRYDPIEEDGKILVICHGPFLANIQPWVDWKIEKGFIVDVIDVSTIGNNASSIEAYIQSEYDADNTLTFVQLVGDGPQVASAYASGGNSDPTYALVDGADNYPDIFIGRFSAENTDHVDTQIERTVHYERDLASGDWFHKGMGVASSQGSGQGDDGEADNVHMDNIRADLLAYNYTEVDQIYDPSANSTMVANALNEGRSEINYCGHGSVSSWSSSGFSISHINQLTNDNMLPFICSVACVNGNFNSNTCFAEAWMRATNNSTGLPTGAIGIYASTINQSWAPPMSAQDESVDLLCAEDKLTLGGLWYNGSCLMMDEYGSQGVSMYNTWHIFGDASLMVRTDTPAPLTVTHLPTLFIGLNFFDVNTGVENSRVTLSYDGNILGTGFTDANGDVSLNLTGVPQVPSTLTLTVTAYNHITHQADIDLLPNDGAYLLVNQMNYTDGDDDLFFNGETVNLGMEIYNVGSDPTENLVAQIGTDDPYVTIIDGTEDIGVIGSDQTVNFDEIFQIELHGNIPDEHVVHVELLLVDGTDEWMGEGSFMAYGPNLEFGTLEVNDAAGNGNQMLDPGENVIIWVNVINNGHAEAMASTAYLVCNDPNITINSDMMEFDAVPIGESIMPAFTLSVSEEVEPGTSIPIGFGLYSGDYFFNYTYIPFIGLTAESFEAGLDNYDWQMAGNADWFIDTGVAHEGEHALRSGTIGHNGVTTVQVPMTVAGQSEISFWKRVSSEFNYDFLTFYIDETEMDSWSGDIPWTQETYTVEPGDHVFRWVYSKDNMVSSGNDCAWIDDVIFPMASGEETPIINCGLDEVDFGFVAPGENGIQTFTISNFGNSELNGSIETPSNFEVMLTAPTTRDGQRPSMNFTIPANQAKTYYLVFSPDEEIDYEGTMEITSNDPNMATITVPVQGQGYPLDAGDEGVTPYVTELRGNFPNPFNPETTISFSLAEKSSVRIDIYNVLGQRVRTLVNDTMDAGMHQVVWNGRNQNDHAVSSGIYFMKMKGGRFTFTQKMILLK